MVMFQNGKVIVTSLGCCWSSGGTPHSPDGCRGMEGDSGIIIKDVCEMACEILVGDWC